MSRKFSEDRKFTRPLWEAICVSGTHQGHRCLAGYAYHMPVSPKSPKRKSAMWSLCAPSQVLVVDGQNGLHLFHLLSLPLWIIPSHTGSGLALCLALAPGTLANTPAKANYVLLGVPLLLPLDAGYPDINKPRLGCWVRRDTHPRIPVAQSMASQPPHRWVRPFQTPHQPASSPPAS